MVCTASQGHGDIQAQVIPRAMSMPMVLPQPGSVLMSKTGVNLGVWEGMVELATVTWASQSTSCPLLGASMGEIQPPPWRTDHTDVDVGELAPTLDGIESRNWFPASKLRRQKSWPWPLSEEAVLVELWTDQHNYHRGSDSGLLDGPA